MSDPLGSFLQGLVGDEETPGFRGGYGFRVGLADRKRRRALDEELLRLRRGEAQRADARARREDVAFQRESTEYDRVKRLRTEVGSYLQAPVHHRTLGSYISGQPGTRNVTLSEDATLAQNVGRALGGLSGRPVSDEDALLLGTGMVPSSALQPKRYQPTTRAEWLADMQSLIGARAGQRTQITMDQALKAVERIYGVWDNVAERFNYPTITPAQRIDLARKLSDGSATEKDFPTITPELEAAPSAPDRPGFFRRLWNGLFGGGSEAAPTTPGPTSTSPRGAAGAGSGDAAQRIEQARALISQYGDLNLPHDELASLLSDEGFTPDEIALILDDGSRIPAREPTSSAASAAAAARGRPRP